MCINTMVAFVGGFIFVLILFELDYFIVGWI